MAPPPGIDVSRWQGTIDWQAVKQAGITFAVMRATIGDFFTDDKFAENWQGAKDAGIFRCAYHVLRPDNDAVAQIA
ncbi:MAG: glycosyl hydrolase family 25, partial [Chloroflexi bacterium]|nr:glycosyl hydrolase family 25 [Chloroflexota bacterium]